MLRLRVRHQLQYHNSSVIQQQVLTQPHGDSSLMAELPKAAFR